jgi:hypothetical protein
MGAEMGTPEGDQNFRMKTAWKTSRNGCGRRPRKSMPTVVVREPKSEEFEEALKPAATLKTTAEA